MRPSYVLPSLLSSPQTPHASATVWSRSAPPARIVDGWCRRSSQRREDDCHLAVWAPRRAIGRIRSPFPIGAHAALGGWSVNELPLLGGDLNPLWSVGRRTRVRAIQGVVDRLTRGSGLEDPLLETLTETDPERGRLKTCTCSLGADCRHVWTYRRSRSSKRRYRDDYLFASQAPALAVPTRCERSARHHSLPGNTNRHLRNRPRHDTW